MEQRIKRLLDEYRLSQKWLMHQLRKYGIKVDKTELSNILGESRKGPKVQNVLLVSMDILNRYGLSEWR